MNKERNLFSRGENFAYRSHLFLMNIAAAMDINQLILAREGREDEMILFGAERFKKERDEEIQRRESIISNG